MFVELQLCLRLYSESEFNTIPFKIFICKVSEVSNPSFLTHWLEFKRLCRVTGIKFLAFSTSKDSPCSSTRTPWFRFLRFSSSNSAWTSFVMFAIFSSSSWFTVCYLVECPKWQYINIHPRTGIMSNFRA